MPDAEGRTFYGADSHIMETRSWPTSFADPDIRERIRPMHLSDAAATAALEDELMTAKGWGALGAFDPAERSRALDLLGFDSQLVFSTFAGTQFVGGDPDLVYGGARAHNGRMAAFCADDAQRMFARTEPDLKALPLKASEYVHRQLRFTPFPGEPIGQLIDQAGDDLFMFSSDYPHPEGGTDPLAKFEATLQGVNAGALERFYSANYAELMGARAMAGAGS